MSSIIQSARRLLTVFAHPDDESFGIGGTLALYARRSVETHLVCTTRGEVGDAPDDLRGHASKADMRVAELQCASEVLGLSSVRFLDYRDSGMAGSPHNAHPLATTAASVNAVARKIAWHIRDIRPQVVVTFDPIGGYRHPDHIACHQATIAAFHMAGDARIETDGQPPYAPQKLYFSTFPRVWLRFGVTLLRLFGRDPRRFGANYDVDLVSLAEVDFPIHATIAIREVAALKQRASACHVSQGGDRMMRGPAGWLFRLFGASEQFMRAVPSEPPARMERDLFEGVV